MLQLRSLTVAFLALSLAAGAQALAAPQSGEGEDNKPGVIAPGGGNVIAPGGGNVIAPGGGNRSARPGRSAFGNGPAAAPPKGVAPAPASLEDLPPLQEEPATPAATPTPSPKRR